MTKRGVIFAVALLAAVIGAAVTSFAQFGGGKPLADLSQYRGNIRYDGRFAFVRISYSGFNSGRGVPPWSHDYPAGEYHFLKILDAVTNMSSHMDESSIMSLSDPEMFKFPVIYLIEPGYWTMADSDVTALRAYLQKGGFLIVDDFPLTSRGNIDTWGNFDSQMSRVFPEGRWIRLDEKSPMFHTFFDINDVTNVPTAYNLGSGPQFWALFEDNDPSKRMLAIANYMNDISEFWEWSDTGSYMIANTNEAYKFGVNEFLYGVMH